MEVLKMKLHIRNSAIYVKPMLNLLKKAKSAYYSNLHPSNVCDNKKFWNAVKPLFSDKCISSDPITLIEKTSVRNEEMVSDDKQTAVIFNRFFSNAVKNLNIDYFEHFSFDCVYSENMDPIQNAIEKYRNHPYLLRIVSTNIQEHVLTLLLLERSSNLIGSYFGQWCKLFLYSYLHTY